MPTTSCANESVSNEDEDVYDLLTEDEGVMVAAELHQQLKNYQSVDVAFKVADDSHKKRSKFYVSFSNYVKLLPNNNVIYVKIVQEHLMLQCYKDKQISFEAMRLWLARFKKDAGGYEKVSSQYKRLKLLVAFDKIADFVDIGFESRNPLVCFVSKFLVIIIIVFMIFLLRTRRMYTRHRAEGDLAP